ncbi:MAG TPA: hypothetical protein VF041_10580 [Gemmatimonadaceae bacterium]
MAKTDWFRRTTWTPDDRADFEARLAKSRTPFHKSQRLRIQASHLHGVGTRELTGAALGLLDRVVADFPEPTQLANAHLQRAECLIDLGRPEEALDAYRRALDSQRQLPTVRNDAYLGFAELVLALRRDALYDEVLAVLDEFDADPVFPVQRYRMAASRSRLADARGDRRAAGEWARRALAAVARSESPFRHHEKLGLVDTVEPDVFARLTELAASTSSDA